MPAAAARGTAAPKRARGAGGAAEPVSTAAMTAALAAVAAAGAGDPLAAALDALATLAASPGAAAALEAITDNFVATMTDAWDGQVAAKHEAASGALLRAAAAAAAAAPTTAGATLASACLAGARRRLVYYSLTSGSRARAAPALVWLAAAAGTGRAACAALVAGFDWALPALPDLARPPLHKEGAPPPPWTATDAQRRPAAALVVAAAAAVAAGADAATLAAALPLRGLWGALLDRVDVLPASIAQAAVEAASGAVRRADAPPAAKASAFGDSALTALLALAARAGPAADAASVLVAALLAGDPSLGLAPGDGGAPPPGRARAARALARLRPLASSGHWAVALAAAQRPPAAAASLFELSPIAASADPGAALGRWLAAAALAAAAGRAAARAPPPPLTDMALRGARPPASDSAAERDLWRRGGFAPPLGRVQLSRGVQAPAPAARHAALEAVRATAAGFRPLLMALDGAAAVAPAWRVAAARARAAARAALPDAQALVAAHGAGVASLTKNGDDGSAARLVAASASALAAAARAAPAAAADARLDAARLLPAGCEGWPEPALVASLDALAAVGGAGGAQRPAAAAASLPPLLAAAGLAEAVKAVRLAVDAATTALVAATGCSRLEASAWVGAAPRGALGAPARAALVAAASAVARRPLEATATLEALPPAAAAAGVLAAGAARGALAAARGTAPLSSRAAHAAYVATGLREACEPGAAAALVAALVGGGGAPVAARALAELAGAPVEGDAADNDELTFLLTAPRDAAAARLAGARAENAAVAARARGLPLPTPHLAAASPCQVIQAALEGHIDLARGADAACRPGGAAAAARRATPLATALAARAAAASPSIAAVLLELGSPLYGEPGMAGLARVAAAAACAGSVAAAPLARATDAVLAAFAADPASSSDAATIMAPWAPLESVLVAAAAAGGAGGARVAAAALRAARAVPSESGLAAVDALIDAAWLHLDEPASTALLAAALAAPATRGRAARRARDAAAALAACLAPDAPPDAPAVTAGLVAARRDAAVAAAAALPAALECGALRRERAALLLPTAAAVLARVAAGDGGMVVDGVIDAYAGPLEAYFTAKPGGGGTAPAPRPATALSPAADASLRAHAAAAAGICWRLRPPTDAGRLLKALAPACGWPARAAAPPPSSSGAARPATGERLRALLHLVDAWPGSGRGAAAARGAAAVAATLAHAVAVDAAPQPALETSLWAALDGPLGDTVGRLGGSPTSARARGALAARAGLLAAAVLAAPGAGGAARLRSLRRFVAALIPPDDDDEGDSDGSSSDSDSDGGGAWSDGDRAALPARALATLAADLVRLGLDAAPAAGLDGTPRMEPVPPAAAALGLPPSTALALAALAPPPPPAPPASAELADLLDAALALEAAAGPGPRPAAEAAARALPLLLASYGGTLAPADRSLLRLLTTIDGSATGGPAGARSRFGGRLAAAGFLCGRGAALASAARALSAPLTPAAAAFRAALASRDASPDVRRAALAVCHWPEARTLAGDDADAPDPATAPPPHHPAAADPAWLVPHAVQALTDGAATVTQLAERGALAVCLRALAARDAPLRWAAAEALGRALAQLEAEPAASPVTPQLLMLLRAVRPACGAPGARLPAALAVFAADASLALLSPGAPAYASIVRALLRVPGLDGGDAPMLKSLSAGGRDARTARERALQLLAAGVRTPADAALYRRRFLLEVLQALAPSGLADEAARGLALAALAAAPAAFPGVAADAAERSTLVRALAQGAVAAVRGAAAAEGGDAAADAAVCARSLTTALARLAARAARHAPSAAAPALAAAAGDAASALARAGLDPGDAWPAVLATARDAHRAAVGGSIPLAPCLAAAHVRAAAAAGHAAAAAAAVAALPPAGGDAELVVAALKAAACDGVPAAAAAGVLSWVAAWARGVPPPVTADRARLARAVAAVADTQAPTTVAAVAAPAAGAVEALLEAGGAPAGALGEWRRAFAAGRPPAARKRRAPDPADDGDGEAALAAALARTEAGGAAAPAAPARRVSARRRAV